MSVHDLMRGLSLNPQQQQPIGFVVPPEREDQVDNSEGLRETLAGTKAKRKNILDRYYADQNIKKNIARNATGFSIRQGYAQKFYNNKEWNAHLDGAIDPNKIRSIENPDSALPLVGSMGTEGSYIELNEDDYRSYSENGLFTKAMESYMRAKGAYGLTPFQPDLIPANVIPVKPKPTN
jgi:hypothetical protein